MIQVKILRINVTIWLKWYNKHKYINSYIRKLINRNEGFIYEN